MIRFRWDHVAFTFPRGTCTREWRDKVDEFYCGVVGWKSFDADVFGEDCHYLEPDNQSFIMLSESDDPQVLPPQDMGAIGDPHIQVPHVGVLVDSNVAVNELLAKFEKFREGHPDLRLREYPLYGWGADKHLSHNVHINYMLPIWLEFHWGEKLSVGIPGRLDQDAIMSPVGFGFDAL